MSARVATVFGALGLAFAGLYLRVLHTWNASHHDGAFVNAWDPDTFYHLRRLYWAAQHGEPLVRDPYAVAPAGLLCPWPDALERLTLWLHSGVFGADPDLESTALMVPLLIAIATLSCAWAVFHRSGAAALLGLAAVALGRDAVRVASYGTFDHHGLELLGFVLALLALRGAERSTKEAFAVGLFAFGLGLWMADGGYIAFGAVALAAFLRPTPGLTALIAGGAVGVCIAAGVDGLRGLERTIDPLTSIGIAATLAGAVAFRGFPRRWVGGLLFLLGGAVALKGVLGAAELLSPVAHEVTGYISEAKPLWAVTTPERLIVYVAAVALAALPWLRQEDRALDAVRLVLVIGGVLGVLQAKYGYILPVCVGWVACAAAVKLEGRRRMAWVAAMVALFALETAHVVKRSPSAVAPEHLALAQISKAIDAGAPKQSVFTQGEPSWTVLARPSLGAQVLYWSKRPVTTIPFWGANETAAQFRDTLRALLLPPSKEGTEILDRLRVRYLVIDDVRLASEGAQKLVGVTDPQPSLWAKLSAGTPPPGFHLRLTAGEGWRAVRLYERR